MLIKSNISESELIQHLGKERSLATTDIVHKALLVMQVVYEPVYILYQDPVDII
jgi:lysyl-tRNA synthetase class I